MNILRKTSLLLMIAVLFNALECQAQSSVQVLDRSNAMVAALSIDTQISVNQLLIPTSLQDAAATVEKLEALSLRPNWPVATREHAIYQFTRSLSSLQPHSVDPAILEYLALYQPQVLVHNEDHRGDVVPLFNIPAAASGIQNLWLRLDSEQLATDLLNSDHAEYLESFAQTQNPVIRSGYLDALQHTDYARLEQVRSLALSQLPNNPLVSDVVAGIALVAPQLRTIEALLINGSGPTIAPTLQQLARQISKNELVELLQFAIEMAPTENAALAIASWWPALKTDSAVKQLLIKTMNDPALSAAATLALSNNPTLHSVDQPQPTDGLQTQQLTEWVETRQSSQSHVIAIGYPVPIPVDTPTPFDGFRTYTGLHARHQDLVANSTFVHPESIGTTHDGRTIWAYRLGDIDTLNMEGLPEAATLTNGGIHAREWQSPEVVTGILELFALKESDQHYYDYLRDNVNMVVIPSLNIDGFMQTQRYPTLNYMQIDPTYPNDYPRDGRMRRKNMLDVDEDLYTTFDLLNGVDLNRNNAPFWASSPSNSSGDPHSIVHHGAAAASESETLALDAAAQLGPASELRLYTDVHSFSQVQLWSRSPNDRLTSQNTNAMNLFRSHHLSFPAAKEYYVPGVGPGTEAFGIGSTDEYFTFTYEVPAWTLELEPTGGQPYHAPLLGGSTDYGGFGENFHDGFILPDAEIRRVREQVSESMAAVYFRQAGPPNVQSLRITDSVSGAVVFDSDWQRLDHERRELYSHQLQPLQLNHDYQIWVSFNKPMRWLENDQVADFPGRADGNSTVLTKMMIDDAELNMTISDPQWLTDPGGAPNGYVNYRTDAYRVTINIGDDSTNQALLAGGGEAVLNLFSTDMTGMATDSNPATIAGWSDGHWSDYENNYDQQTDSGGIDRQIKVQVTDSQVDPVFMVDVSMSTSWFDPDHSGEGWLLEILPGDVALIFWYTYDKQGEQDWYIGLGEVQGNSIVFPDIYQASGGEFGPGFDPDSIVRTTVGSASFIWTDCNTGTMSYQFGAEQGRQSLSRITSLWGLPCPTPAAPPDSISELAKLSGPWYDPSHNGEGYNLAVLQDDRVLVYWFTFDVEGNRRWFYGVGEDRSGVIVVDEMLTTSGGVFGAEFTPDDVVQAPWGTLELAIDCNGGTATYSSTEAGFESGTLNIVKVANLDSPVSCLP